ncbi:NUDIX hydrolase [Polaribacter sp.]|uniref:NUDIX hydrolase n=1 Tax=Polaribacter sp. TaxID=1920175 RepID=UPI003F697F2D
MYKVFVNDKPIIITSSLKNDKNYPTYSFSDLNFDTILSKLKTESIEGILLTSQNLKKDWQHFLSNLKVIKAAGGLVINDERSVLFIHRNGIWDLPKGWIEKNESKKTAAIREVEEECGIRKLVILKKLITTYHIYAYNGLKLKETHWYLMHSSFKKELTPQTEEGIDKVAFIRKSDINNIYKNTYANIKLVYETYKKNL